LKSLVSARPISYFLTMLLIVSVVLAGCGNNSEPTAKGSAESGGKLELKLGHVLSPDSHYSVMTKKLNDILKEETNGNITVTDFPQSQLGGDVQMVQAMQNGTQGLSVTVSTVLTTSIPEYEIFDLPYLFDSFEQANKVLNGPVGQKYLDMLEDKNLVGLGFLSVVERNVFAKKPIKKIGDMKAQKLRVLQGPGHVTSYEALGAQPTPMAYSEVYTALQQGVVDGGDTTPDQFVNDKFIEVADTYNITKVHYLPLVLTMSKPIWDKMSAEDQKILKESAQEALAFQQDYYQEVYDENIGKIKEAGIKVVEPDLAPFKESTKKVYDEVLKNIPNGQELMKEIEDAKKK
jgi:TRAP-type transport system periplasmic protein